MNAIILTSLLITTAIRIQAQGFNPTTPQTSPPAAELPAGTAFGAGLLREEGEGDLAQAADAYRQVIQAFDRQREGAANAIFRLGEVYRKMGRIEEAKVQYARILREFPDLVRLTELSHGFLLGDQPKPTRRSTSGGLGGRPAGEGGMAGGSGRTSPLPVPLAAAPASGNVVPKDTSTSDSLSVAPGMSEIMRRRYGLGGTPLSSILAINVLRDGGLTVNGGPMDLAGVSQLLQQMPDEKRAGTVVEIKADVKVEYSRIAELLKLGQEARIARITLGTEPQSAVQQEIARLEGECESLRLDSNRIEAELSRLSARLSQSEAATAEARDRDSQAQERLEALRISAERLPAVVGQDTRYQQLKADYEKAVLDNDPAARERTLARLQEWVKKIYRPELESEVELAQRRVEQRTMEAADLVHKQQALQAQGEKLNLQLKASTKRIRELQAMLHQPV